MSKRYAPNQNDQQRRANGRNGMTGGNIFGQGSYENLKPSSGFIANGKAELTKQKNQDLAQSSIQDIMRLNSQVFGDLGGGQKAIGDSSGRAESNPWKQVTGTVKNSAGRIQENANHANSSVPDSQDFRNAEDQVKEGMKEVGPVLQDVAIGVGTGLANGEGGMALVSGGMSAMTSAQARAEERKAERVAKGDRMDFEETIQDRLLNEFGDGTSENQGRQFTPKYEQDGRYDDLQSRLYDYVRNNGGVQERSTRNREGDKSNAYNNHGGRMNDINSGYQNVNNGYGQAMNSQDRQLMQAMGMTDRINSPAVNQANQYGGTSTRAENLNNYQTDPRFLNSVSGNLERSQGNYENIQNNSDSLINSAMERFNEEEADSIKGYQDMLANQGLDRSGAEWSAINDIKSQFSKDKRKSIQDIMQSEQQRVFGNQQTSMNQMNNLANSGTGIQSNNLNQTINASNGSQNAMRNRLDFTNQGADRSMDSLRQSLGFGQEAMNNQSNFADSQGKNYSNQLAISQLIGQNDIMSADQQYNSEMSGVQGKMDNTQVLMRILEGIENRDMGYSDYGFNRDMQLSNRGMQEVNALNGLNAQSNAQNNFQANMDYQNNSDKNAMIQQTASGAMNFMNSDAGKGFFDWIKGSGGGGGGSGIGGGVDMNWGGGTGGMALA